MRPDEISQTVEDGGTGRAARKKKSSKESGRAKKKSERVETGEEQRSWFGDVEGEESVSQK